MPTTATTRTASPGPPADAWASTDPLGEALHALRLSGVVYARSHLTAPWGLALPAMPECLLFHVVTAGRCVLEIASQPPVELAPGRFALVPHGRGHRLVHAAGAEATDFFDLPVRRVAPRYETLEHGGGGEATTLVCGAVRFEHPAARDLVERLPPTVQIDAAESPHARWMRGTLDLMAAEAASPRPGGETIVTRLADILVVQAIRGWLDRTPEADAGWLGGLRDPRIGPVLTAVHREPMKPWTVAAMAEAASMSRSSFAERFRRRVGRSPMAYLTRWRMHVAAAWLGEHDVTLAQCAGRLGYESEAAFSRAFRREMGVSPGGWRKRRSAAAAEPSPST